MKQRIFLTTMLLLAATFLACSHAFAQSIVTVTQSQNFSLTDPTGGGATDTLTPFNSAAPTTPFNYSLTEVDISLNNVILTGTISVTNQNAPGNSVSYNGIALGGQYKLSSTTPSTTPTTIVKTLVNVSYSDSPEIDGGTTYTTPSTASAAPGMGANVSATLTDTASLAFYDTSSPTITLYLSDLLSASANGFGPHAEAESGTGTGTFVVTYIYTPVPEPATTAAWTLGLCLFAYVGRRYISNGRLTFLRA